MGIKKNLRHGGAKTLSNLTSLRRFGKGKKTSREGKMGK